MKKTSNLFGIVVGAIIMTMVAACESPVTGSGNTPKGQNETMASALINVPGVSPDLETTLAVNEDSRFSRIYKYHVIFRDSGGNPKYDETKVVSGFPLIIDKLPIGMYTLEMFALSAENEVLADTDGHISVTLVAGSNKIFLTLVWRIGPEGPGIIIEYTASAVIQIEFRDPEDVVHAFNNMENLINWLEKEAAPNTADTPYNIAMYGLNLETDILQQQELYKLYTALIGKETKYIRLDLRACEARTITDTSLFFQYLDTFDGRSRHYGMNSFVYLAFPSGLTSIGDSAIFHYFNLTQIKLPASLKTLGAGAFMWCRLKEVELPAGLTLIGDFCFQGDTFLSQVISHAETPPFLGAEVFTGTHQNLVIKVPPQSVNLYKTQWSSYADRIVAID